MKYVPDKARRAVAAELKEVYTAPNEDAALAAFTEFADSDLGKKYPAAVGVWERAWDRNTGVPGVPTRSPEDHLHHQRDRRPEPTHPQDHQEPGALPQRRRRDQTDLAGHPRHRRQTRPSQGKGEEQATKQA